MLIRHAGVDGRQIADVRVEAGVIVEIGADLAANDDPVIDADGCALLPGLHDHHLHLNAFAASLESIACGLPQVDSAKALQGVLRSAARERPPGEWLRGVGYHESVAGEIDRTFLDACVPDRPVRIQHRSGRLWIFNSAALSALGTDGPFERIKGERSGRLYDADAWLRGKLGHKPPDLSAASRQLARCGVTGVTDTTPDNGPDALRQFASAQRSGALLQRVVVMGDASLDGVTGTDPLRIGARKFHLHDADLPDLEATAATIRAAHGAGRACAFHCVTRGELVFALAALREAGAVEGDRIEHAGVTPPELLADIRLLGLAVVTQPNFIAERGDRYLADVDGADRPWLYRLRGFVEAGVTLAGSTDAPFGGANPWAAMQAAVTRRSRAGAVIGAGESLTPEQALALFLSDPEALGRRRGVTVGQAADLCLLTASWEAARKDLARVRVALTLRGGEVIWSALEEPSLSY